MVWRRASDAAGFTLPELLIVLVIVAILGTLAMSPLERMMDRWNFFLERRDLERQINRLPQAARGTRRAIVLTSSPDLRSPSIDYPLRLPKGWALQVSDPIRYRFDGTCDGGSVSILAAGAAVARYALTAPLCELRPE